MNTARRLPKRDASNFDDYLMVGLLTTLFIGLFVALILL
jgi:hypothetical protein